ncbi:uncharacterized protein [Oryza sativa Japonica Group]|uniref:Histone H2B n=2 Tax=Oryza TaxID=4527 RepID=Q651B5_ORYSJ|nr:late histone H2B.L4 [Oryza sativa Japonica Group]KAF2917629.1 hypothetical protein DAI22_09g207400 [Oryza sativa Japonica Group]BAD46602.1 putative Histone H2B [Oryza sativa Japonica Group]BAH94723.1 Os09g0570850 [Oryza sativa Japonica Group]|eukprot:NP_001175995.1 Os09g0570850 [Oryza sativa Japonica Group]
MAPKQKEAANKKKKKKEVAVLVKTKTKVVQLTTTTAELELEPTVTVQVDDNKTGAAADETPPVVPLQSQETQDPNEPKAAAAKKKKRAGHGRKRSRRRRGGALEYGGYKRYVWRVLKQVHPDLGASAQTMDVLDMMMADMFERLADEASRLSKLSGRLTLTSREVQSAVRLVLPADLANHAISEGTKAISNYLS